MNDKKFSGILSYVLVAVLTAAITVFLIVGAQSVGIGQSKLDVLEKLILDRFIGDADKAAMEDAAAYAMVDALGDRWSYYIPAEQYAQYQEQKNNAYVGIGVSIKLLPNQGGLEITGVTVGGSAEAAGLLAGDRIVAVDGQSILAMTVEQVKELIRGEVNTNVQITVMRLTEERTVTVTRKQIKSPVAMAKMLENHIGLVTIKNFNANSKSETIGAIEQLLAQGAQKLIFDVRYNPGGSAEEMVGILDHLLPAVEVFRTEDYRGNTSVEYSDEKCLDIPMAVVVNGESYSAAEFFAAALSEYEWAVVVGEKTCGKGYFQYTYQLPDGSAVGLSVGRYYTPKGLSLANVGVTPNVLQTVTKEQAQAIYAGTLAPESDPQIQAAVNALNENS